MNQSKAVPPIRNDAHSPVRVLVVDDSAFMRLTISQNLNEYPEIQVVGSARDGIEALEMIPRLQPNVVTLDVEMPRLDGISTLRRIMAEYPRPVIMLSSLTRDGAVETIQALTLGAVDFVAKPTQKANIKSVMNEVANKIIQAAQAGNYAVPRIRQPLTEPVHTAKENCRLPGPDDRIVLIGSSTGGPRALNLLVPELASHIPAAYVIVQHMPAGFTRSLAERLDQISALAVKEAQPGDRLQTGQVLLAPGGFHMTFDEAGLVAFNQNPLVHGVRPAIDVTLTSIARYFGKRTLAVILTGMGNDGTTGAQLVRAAGGKVIAEAESTCVVWGMPRSVYEAGAADQVVPLTGIAKAIERVIQSPF
jgi:two-component system, chemotaxis family, protein-glutamate methylesterase/glutaminase